MEEVRKTQPPPRRNGLRLYEELTKWITYLDHTLPQAAEKSKKEGYPVAALVIQTNLLEFHLMQLLVGLNVYIREHAAENQARSGKPVAVPATKTPVEYRKERYTLGKLIRELERVEFPSSKELIAVLKTFNNKIRPLFVHNLTSAENVMSETQLNALASEAYDLAQELTGNIKYTYNKVLR